MNPRRLLLCLAAFISVSHPTRSAAQEEEKEPPAHIYARDERTELAISPATEKDGMPSVEFRAFGSAKQGRILYTGVTFERRDADGTYEARIAGEEDGAKGEALRLKGEPGADSIEIAKLKLPTLTDTEVEVGGVYKRLTGDEAPGRARRRFEESDALLNKTYQALTSRVSKTQVADLRERQRDWITRRDNSAVWNARDAEKPESKVEYWDDMLSSTVTRIEFLHAYEGKGVPKGISGAYRDFEGGHLEIEEKQGKLHFFVEVVRGNSLANGGIDGVAQLKKGKAYFKEEVPKEEDRPPAELTFTFHGGHRVKVQGKNTDHHHGARAYFDGDYFKVGPLKESLVDSHE